jgi:AcrR family transcriptional regulator
MTRPVLIRPGGRSERIQQTVHAAVKQLLGEMDERSLTVPLIAARAEVTPSTIYRRWNTVSELLAAVATAHFHADKDPPNTGTFEGDLVTWLEHFVDDISSGPGRALLHERIANVEVARRAAGYAYANLRKLVSQARGRGEAVHHPDRLMDLIVAPIIYRVAFAGQPITRQYQRDLIEVILKLPSLAAPSGQSSYGDYEEYSEAIAEE